MRKTFFLLITAFLFFTQAVSAEEFVVTDIGALKTQGKKFNQWWYEPQRVVLKGTGSRGANIDVTVDGKFNTVHADVNNGTWQFDAGTLSVADHSFIVGSGTQSYSFILTIGSAPPADMNTTKGGLPQAGAVLPLVGITSLAGALIFYSFKRRDA